LANSEGDCKGHRTTPLLSGHSYETEGVRQQLPCASGTPQCMKWLCAPCHARWDRRRSRL